MNDKVYMLRALALAKKGRYTVQPNPCVGCVIVKNGRIVGEGWHRRYGEIHAEISALQQAGGQAKGASVYVTLEPCSHYGQTPPCCQALIQAGVARVVCAIQDPSDKVNGKGFEKLRSAGIAVEVGLLQPESRALNLGFFSIAEKGRPWIRIKSAMTVDGHTALESGDSAWISNEASRRDVQFWRASAAALMTGFGTVIADDPGLNVRLSAQELGIEGEVRQPLRIVADSRLKTSPDAKIYSGHGKAIVATISDDEKKQRSFKEAGVGIWSFEAAAGKVPLDKLFRRFAEEQINEVQVEAGSKLVGALLEAGLYDEVLLYMTPSLFGSGRPLAELPPIGNMNQQHEFAWREIKTIGDNLRILLRNKENNYV